MAIDFAFCSGRGRSWTLILYLSSTHTRAACSPGDFDWWQECHKKINSLGCISDDETEPCGVRFDPSCHK